MSVKTVALDFDGMIHRYSKGWHDGTIYDDPMPGAIQGIKRLQQRYAVYVLTSREPLSVCRWLEERDVPATVDLPPDNVPQFWNSQGIVLVTNRKLPAIAYVDDRAVVFAGWRQLDRQLAGAESGNFGPACCDGHGRRCEHGELCCYFCTEGGHDGLTGHGGPGLAMGTFCSVPDLSGAS